MNICRKLSQMHRRGGGVERGDVLLAPDRMVLGKPVDIAKVIQRALEFHFNTDPLCLALSTPGSEGRGKALKVVEEPSLNGLRPVRPRQTLW